MEGLRAYNVVRDPPRSRLLPLADHRALRRPPRARRSPQRDAPGRLADNALLVPGDDEAVGLHRQEAHPPGQGHPAGGALPGRLPVREEAAVVLPLLRGASRRDARARGRGRQVRHDHEPHDLLLRDRRPGVHAGVRVRGARGLHAPDDDAARDRGVALDRAGHADLRRRTRTGSLGARQRSTAPSSTPTAG